MEPKTVKAQAGKTLTITLKDDAKVLNDVVVIAIASINAAIKAAAKSMAKISIPNSMIKLLL